MIANLGKFITTKNFEGKYITIKLDEYSNFYRYFIADKSINIPANFSEEIFVNLPTNLDEHLAPITGNTGVSQFVVVKNGAIKYRASEDINPSFYSGGYIFKKTN